MFTMGQLGAITVILEGYCFGLVWCGAFFLFFCKTKTTAPINCFWKIWGP